MNSMELEYGNQVDGIDMKTYGMYDQGELNDDSNNDEEDYRQDISSPGTPNSTGFQVPALIGHEDQSGIGLRRRAARFSRGEGETRPHRFSTGGNGNMYPYSTIRPKRVLQNWERINSFPNATIAEEALKTYQNCRWMKGNKSNTKEGRKEYYSCREGTACPAMVHLLYDAKSPNVFMFQNDAEHVHIGERKRGLPAQVEQIIRQLYATGTKKPSQIQSFIVKNGMKEIQKSQLANFLQKLKREAGDLEQESDPFYLADRSGVNESFHGSWLSPTENGSGAHLGDSHSEMSLGGIAPLEFAATEYNSPSQDNSQEAAAGPSNVLLNFSGLTPAHTLQHERSGLQTPITPGNQSEIVSSSCGKKFYCRDESTEDGEHCLPNEENIKELVLHHLKLNYSNRDMLHIREELRTLKKEKKYPVLIRLLSFTAGFLQDTFMEDHSTN